jgi:TetR/AcrR family tetracycline transcriptional repressor
MRRYRDGARVMAGTMVEHPRMMELMEQTLTLMADAGIPPAHTARAVAVLLHFTVGFTIEEQAHLGQDYDENPYSSERIGDLFDPRRFPLLSTVRAEIDMHDPEADFAFGLRIVLTGIRATAIDVRA